MGLSHPAHPGIVLAGSRGQDLLHLTVPKAPPASHWDGVQSQLGYLLLAQEAWRALVEDRSSNPHYPAETEVHPLGLSGG